ncbi:MAG: DUF5752 family protein [Pyrobaculum sp.]|jgi:hypothetical protein
MEFKFYTAYYISLYTRRRASTLRELAAGIREVDKYTLFHHVFHAIRSKHLLPPKYSNDFAKWVGEEVGDEELAAELSDISGAEPNTIEDIRKELLQVLVDKADERRGREPFIFVAMEPVVVETDYVARSPEELLYALEEVPGESVIYHFVTRRILGGYVKNDFSLWLEAWGLTEAASELSRIDPLAYSSEEALRQDIVKTLKKWV